MEEKEMIVASAIQLTDGRVFVGKRHGDCFKNIIDLHLKIGMEFEPARQLHFNCEQGFINDKLQFLNREQAYYEAYECKQCRKQEYKGNVKVNNELALKYNNGLYIEPSNWKPCLFSEDLW